MKRARRELAAVPAAAQFDDATFFKHLNARHLADLGMSQPLDYSTTYSDGLIRTHRAFHDRVHDIAVPGQHNHEHVEGD